jgi:acylphosphatase
MTTHVYISGRVQKVGFRRYVKGHAKKHGVMGWVKNLPDGRVEAVFTGDEEKVKKLVDISKKGPFLANVKDVEVDWNHKTTEEVFDFLITR